MNKYDILGRIDEGAYGVVWKALNKETGNFGKKSVIQLRLNNSGKETIIPL